LEHWEHDCCDVDLLDGEGFFLPWLYDEKEICGKSRSGGKKSSDSGRPPPSDLTEKEKSCPFNNLALLNGKTGTTFCRLKR